MDKLYLIGVFNDCDGLRFFSYDQMIEAETRVLIESSYGASIGIVKSARAFEENEIPEETPIETFYPKIMSIAKDEELNIYNNYVLQARKVKRVIQKDVVEMNIPMYLNQCYISIDGTRLLVTYTADDKVDFRDLLKVLKSQFSAKIELRQIGARDKAKMIGGVGICGLPICCSTFLKSFEGISINLAKNQMLILNTSKLVGQCNKFMCCLKYEDELYTELKKRFPANHELVVRDNITYKVTSLNVLTDTIILETDDGTVLEINSEEYMKLKHGDDFKSTTHVSPLKKKTQTQQINKAEIKEAAKANSVKISTPEKPQPKVSKPQQQEVKAVENKHPIAKKVENQKVENKKVENNTATQEKAEQHKHNSPFPKKKKQNNQQNFNKPNDKNNNKSNNTPNENKNNSPKSQTQNTQPKPKITKISSPNKSGGFLGNIQTTDGKLDPTKLKSKDEK